MNKLIIPNKSVVWIILSIKSKQLLKLFGIPYLVPEMLYLLTLKNRCIIGLS